MFQLRILINYLTEFDTHVRAQLYHQRMSTKLYSYFKDLRRVNMTFKKIFKIYRDLGQLICVMVEMILLSIYIGFMHTFNNVDRIYSIHALNCFFDRVL